MRKAQRATLCLFVDENFKWSSRQVPEGLHVVSDWTTKFIRRVTYDLLTRRFLRKQRRGVYVYRVAQR